MIASCAGTSTRTKVGYGTVAAGMAIGTVAAHHAAEAREAQDRAKHLLAAPSSRNYIAEQYRAQVELRNTERTRAMMVGTLGLTLVAAGTAVVIDSPARGSARPSRGRWYGWKIALADVVSGVFIAAGLDALRNRRENESATSGGVMLGIGVTGAFVAPATLHLLERDYGGALLGTSTRFATLYLIVTDHLDGERAAAAIVGTALLDMAWSWAQVPGDLTVTPTSGGAAVGLRGRF